MNINRLIAAFAMLLGAGLTAYASIPQTDAVLYGTITIDGQMITAADNVTVTVRRSAGGPSHGSYRMGDLGAQAGNNYVARVRLESLADGTAQSADAALVGQTVFLYVKDDRPGHVAPEQLLQGSTYVVPRAGMVERRNLGTSTVLLGDVDGNGVIDNADLSFFVRVLLQVDTDPGRVQRSDINNSGTPDGDDIQPFVNLFIVP